MSIQTATAEQTGLHTLVYTGSYTPIEHYHMDDRATNGATVKNGN
jgi:hypothetical protein